MVRSAVLVKLVMAGSAGMSEAITQHEIQEIVAAEIHKELNPQAPVRL